MNDERDTLPPTDDPLMAIAARLEDKIDRLTSIATMCFDKLLTHESALSDLEERVAFFESVRKHGNGSVLPDAE